MGATRAVSPKPLLRPPLCPVPRGIWRIPIRHRIHPRHAEAVRGPVGLPTDVDRDGRRGHGGHRPSHAPPARILEPLESPGRSDPVTDKEPDSGSDTAGKVIMYLFIGAVLLILLVFGTCGLLIR